MIASDSTDHSTSEWNDGPVPIWVPDPADPNGVEGNWVLADPASAELNQVQAAQARAVADHWSAYRHNAVA